MTGMFRGRGIHNLLLTLVYVAAVAAAAVAVVAAATDSDGNDEACLFSRTVLDNED